MEIFSISELDDFIPCKRHLSKNENHQLLLEWLLEMAELQELRQDQKEQVVENCQQRSKL